MNTNRANWNEVRSFLREAQQCLVPGRGTQKSPAVPNGVLIGSLDEFEEFLDHDEFELAWDALAAVAERMNAPRMCWQKLAQAAELMGLVTKQEAALQALSRGP